MKKLILMAGVASLAACAETATDEAPAEDVAMEADAAMVAEDDGLTMRSWTFEGPEGEAMIASVDADGNYITEADGAHVDHGTVTLNDEGKICFDSAMDQPDGCWTYENIEVGASMDTTADDGRTTTVTRTEYTELSMPGA